MTATELPGQPGTPPVSLWKTRTCLRLANDHVQNSLAERDRDPAACILPLLIPSDENKPLRSVRRPAAFCPVRIYLIAAAANITLLGTHTVGLLS
jgi:hypothetical protein